MGSVTESTRKMFNNMTLDEMRAEAASMSAEERKKKCEELK